MARTGRFVLATTAILAAAIALSGCSAPALESAASEPEASTAPTVAPGPVALTMEEAATRYLSIVCPINSASSTLYDAYKVGESEYLGGGNPDASAVIAAAIVIRDKQRLAIEQLDDKYFTWPELVAPQIPHIRSGYMANMAVVTSISLSDSFAAAYKVPAAEQTPEEKSAAQEIRYQLAISADTVASCVGYEDGLSVLVEEKAERDAALAKLG